MQEAKRVFNNALNIAFYGSGITLLLVLLGFGALSSSIVEPLLHLTDMSQSIASGDYSQRVPIPGRAELGRLSAAFNVMAENLEQTVHGEQSAIRTRLEALNQLASHVSRSLYARDRAELLVMTLKKDFGASFAQVLIPEARQGWVSVDVQAATPVEYHLFSALPEEFVAVTSSHRIPAAGPERIRRGGVDLPPSSRRPALRYPEDPIPE